MSNSILVTGGAGFIGSHLIERLLRERDEPIVCLDNFNGFYDPATKRANVAAFAGNARVTLIEGDFCDAPAMGALFADRSISNVVHLGAYAGVRPSVANPLVYQQVNVGGTLSLLEAARHHKVDRFVFVSSSTVYGQPATAPFVEDAPLGRPLSPYGASKRAAETFGMTYFQLHRVPVVCLRPFSVYGPRLRPDLALSIWAKAILTGNKLPLFGDGTVRRDFTHVSDVCTGLLAALERPNVIGEAINLGHDEPIELRQVISSLEDDLGVTATINRLPQPPGEMAVTHADLTKARRLLGYQPRVSLDEGIREFVDWYRREGRIGGIADLQVGSSRA